jgi:hypothetical protein
VARHTPIRLCLALDMPDQPHSDVPRHEAVLRALAVGTRLTAVEQIDLTWRFQFGETWAADTETYWRLLADGRLAAAQSDHGHPFGLGHAFDAAAAVLARLTTPLTAVEITTPACDLRLHFADAVLELLNTSVGYEGWRVAAGHHPNAGWLVSLGGGGIAGSL